MKKLLAYSLILGEDYDLALKYIAQILKPTPSDATANSLAGFCYEKLGRIDDADFANAFFGIWLNERTSAPDLRAALLRPAEG